MVEPISDPAYWRDRLACYNASNPHHIIMKMDIDEWGKIESVHRLLLAQLLKPNDSILDAGCGYGRLLRLMPTTWRGEYLGVDLSPDFIELARKEHPDCDFVVGRLDDLSRIAYVPNQDNPLKKFDWCVCVSIREMVIKNEGESSWTSKLAQMRKISKRVLILEYNVNDKGEIL